MLPYAWPWTRPDNLYIADSSNNVVREVNAKTGIITTVAGNGNGCLASMTTGVAATAAPLCEPQGLAVDGLGNLYIADSQWQEVLKVAKTSGLLTIVAGNGRRGYTGDGGLAVNAKLNDPMVLAVDGALKLYIADDGNCAIREVSNGAIGSMVGSLVQYGYRDCGFGSGVPASEATIMYPVGLAVDASGNLLVPTAQCIRVIGASNHDIYTVAGRDEYGYSGDGGPALDATLFYPNGIALDASGNLYIADFYNNAIRKVTKATALPTGAPAISPASGTVSAPVTVTITPAVAGSTIYYTTDGTLPTTASARYTATLCPQRNGRGDGLRHGSRRGQFDRLGCRLPLCARACDRARLGNRHQGYSRNHLRSQLQSDALLHYRRLRPHRDGRHGQTLFRCHFHLRHHHLRAAAWTSAADRGNVYSAWSPIAGQVTPC